MKIRVHSYSLDVFVHWANRQRHFYLNGNVFAPIAPNFRLLYIRRKAWK